MNLRDLPSVAELAAHLEADGTSLPAAVLTVIAREAIDRARRTITAGDEPDPAGDAAQAVAALEARRPQRIVNATGVLLHTNLGRAPLAEEAARTAGTIATNYSNVELDPMTGKRGGRGSYAAQLLTGLTGAEAAFAVNNNAGALLLALAALAGDGGAIVSRGEEIEIGGSFRLPELMAASGAKLIEVGTTNRTRTKDYERVIGRAAVILKVHPSNYRLEGFAESASYGDLAALASLHGLPLIADVGSGLLDARVPWLPGSPPNWLANEPGVRQTLAAGADIVLFSGDKLLGGPQAGIAVGRADLIGRMTRHPLARAVRLDGSAHAALAMTLEMYASGHADEIPFWKMASLGYQELEERHHKLADALDFGGSVVAGESVPGAGSVPGETIPSPNLRLAGSADQTWRRLLASTPPIMARRSEGALLIDLRSVDPADDEHIAAALNG